MSKIEKLKDEVVKFLVNIFTIGVIIGAVIFLVTILLPLNSVVLLFSGIGFLGSVYCISNFVVRCVQILFGVDDCE